jgi:hypothetical protein
MIAARNMDNVALCMGMFLRLMNSNAILTLSECMVNALCCALGPISHASILGKLFKFHMKER